MTKYQKISEEIDNLEKDILELKKKRSRYSSYPPIKLTKRQTALKLRTGNNSDWLFEDIIFEKNGKYTATATVTCDRCFTGKVKIDLTLNNNMEIMYMSIRGNSDDTFNWNDSEETYIRCFYDGMYDRDRVISMQFQKIKNKIIYSL